MYARRSERVDVHCVALPRLLLTHARMATKSSFTAGLVSNDQSFGLESGGSAQKGTVAGSRSGAGKMQREVRTRSAVASELSRPHRRLAGLCMG